MISPIIWLATCGDPALRLVEAQRRADGPEHHRHEALAQSIRSLAARPRRGTARAAASRCVRVVPDREEDAQQPLARAVDAALASTGASSTRGSTGSWSAATNRSSLVPK